MLEHFVPLYPAHLHYCCQLLYYLKRINDDDDDNDDEITHVFSVFRVCKVP